MTAYDYDMKLGVWTKTCPKCDTVTIGVANQEASLSIFAQVFHTSNDQRGSQDGFSSYCKACKEKTRQQKKFGVSSVEKMLIAQNGKCPICEEDLHLVSRYNGDPQRACTDHDHITGKTRGLLCRGCNVSLGKFKDNIRILENAIAYLRRYETVIVPIPRRKI